MNTCLNCQTENRDQAKFCENCGESLSKAALPLSGVLAQTPTPAPADLPRGEPVRREPSGGVKVSGGRVQVGGDVAGRDVVKISQTGLGAAAVQRLVFMIGGMILAVGFCFLLTATCFFSGGIVLGGSIFLALNRPVETSLEAAQQMDQRLNALNALSSGQTFSTKTTEVESSSYLRFILGPRIGVSEPKVRYIAPGRIAVGGKWTALSNLPFAATFKVGTSASPLELEWMAVQILQIPNSDFGWVAVPTLFVQSQVTQVADSILGRVKLETIVDVTPSIPAAPREWQVTGVRR